MKSPPDTSNRTPTDHKAGSLAAERRAFERQRGQLLRRYLGEYVAFYHGQMVAHGKDSEALAARLFGELGDAPFLIARVEKKPTVYDLPSPEVEG